MKTGTVSTPKETLALWVALALFLLLRFWVLGSGLENVSHFDELGVGAFSEEWIHGLKFSIWDYQADYYAGESIALAALGVPFFFLFGSKLIAIKLVTLLLSFAGLMSLCAILRRHFSPKAALYGAFLFCASFPTLIQINLNTMAGHSESAALSFLGLWSFYEYWGRFQTSSPGRIPYLILFSLISGFNLWFHYVSAPLVIACLLTVLFTGPGFFRKKDVVIFLIFFLLGFCPAFIRALQGTAGENRFLIHFLLEPLAGEGLLSAPRKLLAFLFRDYPRSFWMTPFSPSHGIFKGIYSGLYFLVTTLNLVFFGFWAWKIVQKKSADRWKFLPWLLYIPVFLAAYASTSYTLGIEAGYYTMRYLAVWYGILLVTASLNAARTGPLKSGWILLLILGFGAQTQLMLPGPRGRVFEYRATDYAPLAGRFINSPRTPRPETPETWLSLVDRFPSPVIRHSAWLGYLSDAPPWDLAPEKWSRLLQTRKTDASFIAMKLGSSAALLKQEKFHEFVAIPENLKDYAAEGFFEEDLRDGVSDFPGAIPGHRFWFFFNQGRNAYMDIRRQIPAEAPIDTVAREAFFRGFGKEKAVWTLPGRHFFELSEAEALLFSNQADYENYGWGIGWGIRGIFREDPLRAADWINLIPEQFLPTARRGAKAFEERYGFYP